MNSKTKTMLATLIDNVVLEAMREWCEATGQNLNGYIEDLVIKDLSLNHKPNRRRKINSRMRKQIVLDYVDGMSMEQVAEKHNICPLTVFRLLDEMK